MIQFFWAILPLATLIILMAGFKKPTYLSAPIALLTGLTSVYFWGMPLNWIGGALAKGFLITTEILFIVLGAIFLLEVLQRSGAFEPIKNAVERLSPDRRIQAIIVGWLFVSFIEGAAGFGTPAMLAVPLLMILGFPPLISVIICLIGDSTAVTFGAVGVPISIGIAEGVTPAQAIVLGAGFVNTVAGLTASFHLLLGALVPLAMVVVLTLSAEGSIKKGLAIWPYALMAGLVFTIPYFLVAVFLGPEFPSIVGGLVGLIIILPLTKVGFLVPKEKWRFPSESKPETTASSFGFGKLARAFIPYFLIITLLVLSRINFLGLAEFLKQGSLVFGNLFNTGLNHTFDIFYSPGFFFILVTFLAFKFYGLGLKSAGRSFFKALKKISYPAIGLVAVITLVQILIFSANNDMGRAGIPIYLSQLLAINGFLWFFISPLVGLFGSFLAGSSTVSNLLLSAFQVETAMSLGLSPILILSLQAVGSAIGNMVAIHNILAALAVAGLSRSENQVIKKNLPIAFIYVLLAGLLAIFYSFYLIAGS